MIDISSSIYTSIIKPVVVWVLKAEIFPTALNKCLGYIGLVSDVAATLIVVNSSKETSYKSNT
jgi:hypothetical protein